MRALFLMTLGCTGTDKLSFGSNVIGDDGEVIGDDGEDEDVDDSDTLDLRQEYTAADIEFRSPDFEVPPFTETNLCYFGTYDGPTVGIVDFWTIYDTTYIHHNQIKAISDSDAAGFADGDLVDCEEIAMHDRLTPLVEAVGLEASWETIDQDWLNLVDGDAIKLEGGVRYVLDMHFINSSPQTLLVNTGVNLGVVEESEVERWVGVTRFDVGNLEIPPGGEHTEAFACEWPQDLEVLALYGHMHEYGSRFSIHSSLYSEPLYAIDEWTSEYHWLPPIVSFEPGELNALAGESYEVSCTWDNNSDETLGFPTEMCNAVAVVAPLNGTLTCLGGSFVP